MVCVPGHPGAARPQAAASDEIEMFTFADGSAFARSLTVATTLWWAPMMATLAVFADIYNTDL